MIFIKDLHPIPDVQKRIDQESDPLLQVPLSLPSGIDQNLIRIGVVVIDDAVRHQTMNHIQKNRQDTACPEAVQPSAQQYLLLFAAH